MASKKQRGYPDRRGMGAQSDFIGEQFVPDTEYKKQQLAMAQKLIAAGVKPEQLEQMFSVPYHLLSEELAKADPLEDELLKDEKPED